MRLLLDTHTILWALDETSKLSNSALNLIQNTENECFVSIISLYEIAIKKKLGKFQTKYTISEIALEIEKTGIKIIPISENHLDIYEIVPLIEKHRDPFDRLIISIAISENLNIITKDDKFEHWACLVEK
jgi:PIN domain nuclease of toxin-antitoxin system